MKLKLSIALLSLAATAFSSSILSAQSTQAAGTWRVVKSPNGGNQAGGNELLATVALSTADTWAVGAKPNASPSLLTQPLAEHWDGTRWSIVPTPHISAPTAQLNSMAALNSNEIWAAGYSENPSCFCGQTLVERWNGISWTRVTSPNPGVADYLNGISAVSATDVWAVGYEWPSQSTTIPLLMHYDGKGWSTLGQPQFPLGQLTSVFALAQNDVWAVGFFGPLAATQGIALHWNGKSWRQVAFPTESGGGIVLRSVSGANTKDLWAVGDYAYYDFNGNLTRSARSYHWNGSNWKAVTVALGGYSYLYNVMARATDDVWAVGAGDLGNFKYAYVTFHWDGSQWSNVPNPNEGILRAVSASSSSDVWAVGLGFVTRGTHTIHYTVP